MLLLLLILLGVLAAAPRPASAHAATVGSSPAPGSVVGSSPSEVTVTFSEPVAPVSGQIQVIAPDGERINATPVVEGTVLRIPVRKANRPLGTYLVSFRVISADSHPVGGAVTFSVGAPSATPEAASATGSHPSVTLAVPTLKFLGYGGLALITGPALFLAFLWPRRRSRQGPLRLIRIGLALTAVATLGALGTQAQQGSGGALWQVSVSELTTVLDSRYGLLLIARLAALAVLAVLLPTLLSAPARRPSHLPAAAVAAPQLVTVAAGAPHSAPAGPAGPAGSQRSRIGRPAALATSRTGRTSRSPVLVGVVLLVGVLGLATWPLTGHAIAAPMPAVTVAVGVVHLAAMAVWIGGLVTLLGFLLRGTDRRVLGVLLPAWSRWAVLAVIWLAIAGAVQAVVQLGGLAAVWQTGYGRLLLAKLALLAGVLALAATARRLVTRVAATGASRLRRTVGVEIVATVLILGLSAVLVQVDPGRTAGARDRAVAGKGLSETLSSPLYTVQFNIYPVELGEYNTVHAFLYTPAGAPLTPAEWQLSTRLVSQNLEAVKEPFAALPIEHQALGTVTFPVPGTYEIAFTIRVDELNRATVKTTVTVPPR
ncbi:copper resistance CopC/CopD family protein [Actinoplanes missouriensis]|uniref:copper resistance CopC/CopD family protein n=1 Tax=Actinoplanes missouriensis TaxID=1866 RepID=UPI00031A63AF|nr:copper resistance protein CopC [Actinoplanes missouriensis]